MELYFKVRTRYGRMALIRKLPFFKETIFILPLCSLVRKN